MPTASIEARTVDEYIALQPREAREVLGAVRDAIRKALPDAEETISYKMPTYRLRGGGALHFAAWKRHFSLYPASVRLLAAFKDELAAFEVEKSTIRFALRPPVPTGLIERIAKFRAAEAPSRSQRKSSRVHTLAEPSAGGAE
jgi:uncharacterized protein YdhG (YjbR/CyaY superfamily)